jgi:hypothetical protein
VPLSDGFPAGHSVASLALPAAIVCHCMFHGASAPPRFSGRPQRDGRRFRSRAALNTAAGEVPAIKTVHLDAASPSTVGGFRGMGTGTRAAVGLTSRCPYGLGACWGGAYEALQKLDGVQSVRPIANADVYLHGDTLPDVERWAEQIARVANGSYDFRAKRETG